MYKFCFNIHTNEITHTLSLDSSQGAREVKKHLSLTQHKLTEASLEGEVWPYVDPVREIRLEPSSICINHYNNFHYPPPPLVFFNVNNLKKRVVYM